jgi:hypothetical protein
MYCNSGVVVVNLEVVGLDPARTHCRTINKDWVGLMTLIRLISGETILDSTPIQMTAAVRANEGCLNLLAIV